MKEFLETVGLVWLGIGGSAFALVIAASVLERPVMTCHCCKRKFRQDEREWFRTMMAGQELFPECPACQEGKQAFRPTVKKISRPMVGKPVLSIIDTLK